MENATESQSEPAWRPLSATDRRVIGVLVEKAKTTPDAYPMSLNALTSGCNQKNNRAPLMQLVPEDVEESLERLRGMSAVVEVHGDGRIARYKHRLYEWLGVDKVEMAVMAELLLRGAQTIGELRGRAARMEPIADQAALKLVLDALAAKRLILYLTPPQRGAVVTHTLYKEEELEKVRREHAAEADHTPPPSALRPTSALPPTVPSRSGEPSTAAAASSGEIDALRVQVRQLSDEMSELRAALDAATAQLRRDVDDLKQQLGV